MSKKCHRYNSSENEIRRLKEEIDFLNQGIKIREDTHDYLLKEKERQMAITKQLTYLFIIIDSLYKLTDNENVCSLSKEIRNSLESFKADLAERMLSLNNKDTLTDKLWNLQTPMN